jgi:hypothetical protein
MKKVWIILVVLMLLMISPIAARQATVNVNGQPVVLEQKPEIVTGTGDNAVTIFQLATPVKTADYQIVGLVVAFKDDPFISYGMAVIDDGAPSAFSASFSNVVSPKVIGPNQVESSMSLSATDGGSDGVNVTALAPPAGIPVDGDGIAELQVTTVSDGGLPHNIGLDLGGPFVQFNLQSDTWGPFNEGPVAGPVSSNGWDNIRIDVNFQGSGGGDIYTLNGRSDIVPAPSIPEFPTAALPAALIVGLIGAVLFIQKTKEH